MNKTNYETVTNKNLLNYGYTKICTKVFTDSTKAQMKDTTSHTQS